MICEVDFWNILPCCEYEHSTSISFCCCQLKLAFIQSYLKNALLHHDLKNSVHGEYAGKVCQLWKSIYKLNQSLRAWYKKLSQNTYTLDFWCSHCNHFVFIIDSHATKAIHIAYVDITILSSSDVAGIRATKEYLHQYFITKDLGKLQYFLSIEVAHNKFGVSMSQRNALALLEKTWLLRAKLVVPSHGTN